MSLDVQVMDSIREVHGLTSVHVTSVESLEIAPLQDLTDTDKGVSSRGEDVTTGEGAVTSRAHAAAAFDAALAAMKPDGAHRPLGHERYKAPLVKSFRTVHTNRPHSWGGAATFAGGWPG